MLESTCYVVTTRNFMQPSMLYTLAKANEPIFNFFMIIILSFSLMVQSSYRFDILSACILYLKEKKLFQVEYFIRLNGKK